MQLNGKRTVAADPNMKKLSSPSSMEIVLARLERLALKKIANLHTSRSSERHIKNSKGGGGRSTMLNMVAEPEPGAVKSKQPVTPSEAPAIKNMTHVKVLTDTTMADANGAPRVIKFEKAGPVGSSVERAKAKAEVEEPTIEEHSQDVAQPFEPEEHGQDEELPLENKKSMDDFERTTSSNLEDQDHGVEPPRELEELSQDEKSAQQLNDMYKAYEWPYDDSAAPCA